MGKELRQSYKMACSALLGSLLAVSLAPTAADANNNVHRGLNYEYERIGYYNEATDNDVARLAESLESGEVTLEWQGERGYLDSFLEALNISPGSQTLVFSPTSLQHKQISPRTPRALYFNDETYIGYVQNSSLVEVTTMDAELGLVFYMFNNVRQPDQYVERLGQECLVCHDSHGATGGGVPTLMALSSIYTVNNKNLKSLSGDGNVTDRTPVEDRWGGWYVSGWNGAQPHLGNIQLPEPGGLEQLDAAMQTNGNLVTLEGLGLFDTDAYPRPTSDIVALLVLEHQLTVQNALSYVMFKLPAVLERLELPEAVNSADWDSMPERGQQVLTRMLNALVDAMLFVDAAVYQDRIAGLREYEDWFQAQGPSDKLGRSLRDLDLGRRLLKYPMSYLIYTEAFDRLPTYALDYLYTRFADILEGRDQSEDYAHLSARDREAILEILKETKPEIRPYLAQSEAP